MKHANTCWKLALAAMLFQNGCSSMSARQIASNHSEVTPFSDLKSQLEMKPGQTYLGFMRDEVNPELNKFEPVLQAEEAKFPRQYKKWQDDLVAEGQGVAIRINKKNYIFNVGYHDGSHPDDIKSGRSYGVGPTGKESDPSDLAYLSELSAFYKGEPKKTGDFLEALMLALTDCDTSGWNGLSDDGQIVATDFMAIYTAESDRHIMVNLKPHSHPWEIDLAAATFVSVFVAETGKIMKDGKLVPGKVGDWWAKGSVGSGIGETRRDRIALQKLIAKHLETNAAAKSAVKSIESVVGNTDGDAIQGVLEYLNAPQGPKKMSPTERKQLVNGMLQYLEAVRKEAGNIE